MMQNKSNKKQCIKVIFNPKQRRNGYVADKYVALYIHWL